MRKLGTAPSLNAWDAWTSCFFVAGLPCLPVKRRTRLVKLVPWMFDRVWPGRYPALEASLRQFRRVLNDLLDVFSRHAGLDGEEYRTKKFYKIEDWDPDKYHRLHRQYENHVALVEDLAIELTRAANLVCDHVREHLLPSYRLDRGVLTIVRGPGSDMGWTRSRPEYRNAERTGDAYANLEDFKKTRATRDMYIGDWDE